MKDDLKDVRKLLKFLSFKFQACLTLKVSGSGVNQASAFLSRISRHDTSTVPEENFHHFGSLLTKRNVSNYDSKNGVEFLKQKLARNKIISSQLLRDVSFKTFHLFAETIFIVVM